VNWLQEHRHSAIYVGLTLAVPLFIVLYLASTLWGQRMDYQREIERIEPRIARLAGLVDSETALRQSAMRVESRVLDLVFPASEERAALAARLQQDLRRIFTEAGLQIKNSQVLPAREILGLEQVTVKTQVSGELEALDAALEEVSNYSPLILVESLAVTPVRRSRRQRADGLQELTANIQLLAFRQGQGDE
jgi:general secretion pathway protein M